MRLGKDTGGGTGPVELIKAVRGKRAVVANDTYSTASSPFSVKIKVTSTDEADVWVEGTQESTTTGVSAVAAGGVSLASEKAKFSALKVGYDNNADDDIDDAGDDLVVSSPFGSVEITPTHDDAGNLTFDSSRPVFSSTLLKNARHHQHAPKSRQWGDRPIRPTAPFELLGRKPYSFSLDPFASLMA